MNTYLQHTGKEIYPNAHAQHGIKCTVNNTTMKFTVADNEKCSFGLFNTDHCLLGYIHPRSIESDYGSCAAINGRFNIVVKDAPLGSYVKKIESFYLNGFGGVTKVKR